MVVWRLSTLRALGGLYSAPLTLGIKDSEESNQYFRPLVQEPVEPKKATSKSLSLLALLPASRVSLKPSADLDW